MATCIYHDVIKPLEAIDMEIYGPFISKMIAFVFGLLCSMLTVLLKDQYDDISYFLLLVSADWRCCQLSAVAGNIRLNI